jgi:tetratricopeptide (TPR) repeat protein
VSDTDAAVARARRGLSCDPPDEIRVSLLGLLCEACSWRGELQAAAEHADALLGLATPGTAPWVHAVSAKLQSTLMTGKADEHAAALRLLHEVEPQPEAVAGIAFALTGVVYTLDLVCQLDAAEQNLARQRAIVEPVAARDPIARGWMYAIRAIRSSYAHGDPWTGLRAAEASLASFQEIGHRRGVMSARMLLGVNLCHLGALAEARRELSPIMAASEEFGLASSVVASTLAWVLIGQGELEEARATATRFIAAEQARGGLPLDQGRGQLALADALLRLGDIEGAEAAARAALELLALVPLTQMAARAQLAAVHLAAGRTGEALAAAEEAIRSYSAMGDGGFRDVFARVIHAEALRAAGERERAGAAIAAARERVLDQATRIGDAGIRRGFLENVPENARTLTLAREWVGER